MPQKRKQPHRDELEAVLSSDESDVQTKQPKRKGTKARVEKAELAKRTKSQKDYVQALEKKSTKRSEDRDPKGKQPARGPKKQVENRVNKQVPLNVETESDRSPDQSDEDETVIEMSTNEQSKSKLAKEATKKMPLKKAVEIESDHQSVQSGEREATNENPTNGESKSEHAREVIKETSRKIEESSSEQDVSSDDQTPKTASDRFQAVESKVRKMKKEMREIRKNSALTIQMLQAMNAQNPPAKKKKSNEMVPLYDTDDEWEFEIDSERMKFAKDCNTGSAYASRLVSALFNTVGELYKTTWSGQRARTPHGGQLVEKPEKGLNRRKRDALLRAVKQQFPNDRKATKSSIGRAVGNKLASFQKLFEKWKKGSKVDVHEVDGLVAMDRVGILDYDKYKDDPSLFDQLDQLE